MDNMVIEKRVVNILKNEEFIKPNNTDLENKAVAFTKEYCIQKFIDWEENAEIEEIKDDTISDWAYSFYGGYMAAMTGEVNLI